MRLMKLRDRVLKNFRDPHMRANVLALAGGKIIGLALVLSAIYAWIGSPLQAQAALGALRHLTDGSTASGLAIGAGNGSGRLRVGRAGRRARMSRRPTSENPKANSNPLEGFSVGVSQSTIGAAQTSPNLGLFTASATSRITV